MPLDIPRWRAYAGACADNLKLSADDREDAIAEAILAILQAPIQADAYIAKVTANAIRRHYKKLSEQASLTVSADVAHLPTEGISVDVVHAKEIYDQLSPDDQDLLRMDLHGYTEKEIAAELALTVKQVEHRKRNLRLRLQEMTLA